MKKAPANKVYEPAENKSVMVRVKVNPNREIRGVGRAGQIIWLDEQAARELEAQGLVVILDKEN